MSISNIIDIALLAVIVIGIPAYVKKRAEVVAEKGLEKYKNELASASNRELEKLKGEIARNNKWDEIRLARLREEQGVVFKELYSKLSQVFGKGRDLIRVPGEAHESKWPKADDFLHALKDFVASYESNKIWLNDSLCEQIDKLRSEIDAAFAPLQNALYGVGVGANSQLDIVKTSQQALLLLESQIAATRHEVEAKFRELMHV